jgi:hypothetical protein
MHCFSKGRPTQVRQPGVPDTTDRYFIVAAGIFDQPPRFSPVVWMPITANQLDLRVENVSSKSRGFGN